MIRQKYKINVTHQMNQDNLKVIYVIATKQMGSNNGEKITKKRYSEIKQFHQSIVKVFTQMKSQIQMPQFPKRKFFGSTNKSEESIINRQIELQVYFNDLISIDQALSLPQVIEYLPDQLQYAEESDDNLGFNNIRLKIERYSIYEDVVIYFMKFSNLKSYEEWIFQMRYSELRGIHEALSVQQFKCKIPIFPGNKLFGVTNKSPEDIEKRREDLQIYLNEIFSNEEIFNGSVIQYFLSNSKMAYEKTQNLEKLKSVKSISIDIGKQFRQNFE